jgi:hypothetical protein
MQGREKEYNILVANILRDRNCMKILAVDEMIILTGLRLISREGTK